MLSAERAKFRFFLKLAITMLLNKRAVKWFLCSKMRQKTVVENQFHQAMKFRRQGARCCKLSINIKVPVKYHYCFLCKVVLASKIAFFRSSTEKSMNTRQSKPASCKLMSPVFCFCQDWRKMTNCVSSRSSSF